MLDVLLVWIVLAGQMWVYYRLNPGLAVHFSQQSPGFWNSGPLLLCVCFFFCGNSLSYSSYSSLQKVQMQIEVEKSPVCQLTISVNLCDQSTFLIDTLAQFVGVKWSASKCPETPKKKTVKRLWICETQLRIQWQIWQQQKFYWGCVDSMQMDLFQVPHLFLDHFCWPLPDGYAW